MAALAVVTLPADDPSVNLEAGCLLIDRETERLRDRETERGRDRKREGERWREGEGEGQEERERD
jgi:hypothetical protein